jgi:ribose/xylose/arabinose/galactoside ABC-type transport system permease subunit
MSFLEHMFLCICLPILKLYLILVLLDNALNVFNLREHSQAHTKGVILIFSPIVSSYAS